MLWVGQASDVQELWQGKGCKPGSEGTSGACEKQPSMAEVDVSVLLSCLLHSACSAACVKRFHLFLLFTIL